MVVRRNCLRIVLSTKPYRRWIFLSVSGWQKGALLTIRAPLGGFRLFIRIKNWLRKGGWVSSLSFFNRLCNSLLVRLPGVLFGWSVPFELIGYYFRAREFLLPKGRLGSCLVRFYKPGVKGSSVNVLNWPFRFFKRHCSRFRRKRRIRQLRRQAIWFHFGFFYDVVVLLPRSLRIHWRTKTYFILVGSELVTLLAVSAYLRFTRNLFPYKFMGVAVEDERVRGNVSLKPGKKVRYR